MTPAGKAPEESRLTLSQIMGATDTNLLGTVHGGVLMRLADSLAGVVTARHSGGPTVTVAIDEMVFVTPHFFTSAEDLSERGREEKLDIRYWFKSWLH